ncbi:MAG: 1-acyl-sn-glycerol-3-phosphate acyltransferase [Candidatus Binatia bacterium]
MAVTGVKHVPMEGPVLLVARHYHHLLDGAVLLLSIPRPIHIVVTLDWVKTSFGRRLMTMATSMARWPVVLRGDALSESARYDRQRQRNVFRAIDIRGYQRRAVRDSVALLTQGRALVVFPEGYPNIDPHSTVKTHPEEFIRFKAGFAVIAAAAERRLGTRVPIVPCGFRYEKGVRWTVGLNIGEASYLESFVSRRSLVNYLEKRVAELSQPMSLPAPD